MSDSERRVVPLARPDLSGNEERYVVDAVRSGWISSTGPYVGRFEAEFAERCGSAQAIATSNGTVALHLALLALGIGVGDEVIVPSLTYIATANAVRYVGATPVFVDVDPDTWCIDPRLLEECRSPRTRAIIVVHLYGHPADMDPINAYADAHGLAVVEDAAEAFGALYRGRRVGSLATMATFSFYGNKVVSSGEGGAIAVDDAELARRLRLLRGQGMDPERRYFFPIIGYNYRLTNVACAILCAQLEHADVMLARRRAVVGLYQRLLAGVPGLRMQPVADWALPTPWFFSVVVDAAGFGIGRDRLAAELANAGIETRPFFVPLHELPPYVESHRASGRELPVTDVLAAGGINLPTHSGMTDDDVTYVATAVAQASRSPTG